MTIKKLSNSFQPQTLSDVSVLVVDDKPDLREALIMLLDTYGFKNVQEAADGQAALNLLHSEHVDLMISDFEMPRLNGLELLKKVREDEDLRDIPVIITSGTDGIGPVAIAAGANAFVRKPDDIDKMIEAVLQLAGTRIARPSSSPDTSSSHNAAFDPQI